MKKLTGVLSLSIIVLLTAASISYSNTYEIIQLTDNDCLDINPQINESGDVIYTDSEEYDPNVDINLNRSNFKRTPIRKR